MYHLRSVKDGKETTYPPCAYFEKTRVTESSHAAQIGTPVGLHIELCPGGQVIRLPYDADVVYVMDDNMDTKEHIKWDGERPTTDGEGDESRLTTEESEARHG